MLTQDPLGKYLLKKVLQEELVTVIAVPHCILSNFHEDLKNNGFKCVWYPQAYKYQPSENWREMQWFIGTISKV